MEYHIDINEIVFTDNGEELFRITCHNLAAAERLIAVMRETVE